MGGIFAVCLIYSIIRYITLGPEDLSQLPLYVMNKALSWAGLATLGLSRLLGQAAARKQAGLIGALMIGLHVVMSMLILKPEYLHKFFIGAWAVESEEPFLSSTSDRLPQAKNRKLRQWLPEWRNTLGE